MARLAVGKTIITAGSFCCEAHRVVCRGSWHGPKKCAPAPVQDPGPSRIERRVRQSRGGGDCLPARRANGSGANAPTSSELSGLRGAALQQRASAHGSPGGTGVACSRRLYSSCRRSRRNRRNRVTAEDRRGSQGAGRRQRCRRQRSRRLRCWRQDAQPQAGMSACNVAWPERKVSCRLSTVARSHGRTVARSHGRTVARWQGHPDAKFAC